MRNQTIESGFKLKDIIPELKDLYEKLIQENSIETKIKKARQYLLLVHEDSPIYPFIYSNIRFRSNNRIMKAQTLDEKNSYFNVFNYCNNIDLFVDLDAINTNKVFANATRLKIIFKEDNTNIAYVYGSSNFSIIKRVFKMLNIRQKFITIDDKVLKDIENSKHCKIEFECKYQIL